MDLQCKEQEHQENQASSQGESVTISEKQQLDVIHNA